MNKKEQAVIEGLYNEAHNMKREEIVKMLKQGTLEPVGSYVDFSEDTKEEQDAWNYIEHYCYREPYQNSGEELANKQGFLQGVEFAVRKLGIKEITYN